MRRVFVVVIFGLVGCSTQPCPDGQARTNSGQCVAIAVPQQSLDDFDPFPAQARAPTKMEYIADQNAIADFNEAQVVKRAAEDAEMAADRRTDRIVEAQHATQREIQELKDEVRQ